MRYECASSTDPDQHAQFEYGSENYDSLSHNITRFLPSGRLMGKGKRQKYHALLLNLFAFTQKGSVPI